MEKQAENMIAIYISHCRSEEIYEWVKEFAGKLQEELKMSSRFPVTIKLSYERSEPDSGVSNSMIFIPVLTADYCHEENENWQELISFKRLCSNDNIGLNITLPCKSELSRILPVLINPVSDRDLLKMEKELEGNMQSFDFIFNMSAGVNRPLRVTDTFLGHEGTFYNTQIKKLSNTIIQIITSIQSIQKTNEQTNNRIIEQMNNRTGEDVSKSVYLAWTADDCKRIRDETALVLQKAGMTLFPVIDCPIDEALLKLNVNKFLSKAACSVHILGSSTGRKIGKEEEPVSIFQINEAKKKIESDPDFKMFIWNISQSLNKLLEPEQQKIITNIRNNICHNITFTNAPSPVQLADDLRSLLAAKKDIEETSEKYEVFFMCNFLDESDAIEITDMLSDILQVETLIIGENTAVDYGQISVRYIKNSKLAVVFFNEATAWAIPFVQQVWKMIGGASSNTSILLIGEESNKENTSVVFKAPKVISKITSKNLVPLEVKALYDKIEKNQ
ncbi:MAG: hypothetical protein HY958_13260 [Bacteroidia bacterium]|nr:hypothetical protein [Bacteroidia bacterium]